MLAAGVSIKTQVGHGLSESLDNRGRGCDLWRSPIYCRSSSDGLCLTFDLGQCEVK